MDHEIINQTDISDMTAAPAAAEKKSSWLRQIPWSKVYIGLTIAVVLGFGLFNQEFDNVFSTLAGLQPGYLLLAAGTLLAYLVFEAFILRLLMKSQGILLSHPKSFKIGFLGIYYSAITPSATGGQPMQSAYLYRDRVPAGKSAAVLVMKFFAFQCAFTLVALVSFLFMYPTLQRMVPAMIPLIILGLIVNGLSVIFFPSLFFKPVLHKIVRLAKWVVNRFKFLRRREGLLASIDKFGADFGSYTDDFKKKKKSLMIAVLLSVPQFILQMSIIYFVYRAFRYPAGGYLQILATQSLLQVAVSFMPMPGASGAQELGFRELFSIFFVRGDLYTAVMVWRFITYYLVLLSGAGMVIVDQFLHDRAKRRRGKRQAAVMEEASPADQTGDEALTE